MALISANEIIPAFNARLVAQQFSQGDNTLQANIATSINAAVASGLFTCTVACAAFTPLNIQDKIVLLTSLGYGMSYSGSTLTLTW